MYEYFLNLFRPYQQNCRNEMSVTRAFVIACAKSSKRDAFVQAVLNTAGLNVTLKPGVSNWGLEVPGQACRKNSANIKVVLCISPQDSIAEEEIMKDIYTADTDMIHSFSNVVLRNVETPDFESFRKYLLKILPRFMQVLDGKEEYEAASILSMAYWDIWRLLYAGARMDAVLWNDDLVCLMESKIWGGVSEIQARNHAQEAFGNPDVPIMAITWQTIYEIAQKFDDPIISDFSEYLAEFPQLVRWNGFDGQDVAAFEMNTGALEAEPLLINRLYARYWQCMEELCRTYNYAVSARRGDDWDFTPKGYNLVGNTGIGYWGEGGLAAKWCVGYHAWEMDKIMSYPDLLERGLAACDDFASSLSEDGAMEGLSVQFRAVQRFQFVNALDGSFFGSPICILKNKETTADALKDLWKSELAMLKEYHERRGIELISSEALNIKRQIYKMRHPDKDETTISMATNHSTWRLFAAFDVFVWINPKLFFVDESGAFLGKCDQLARLDKVVNCIAAFAQSISVTSGT